VAEIRTLQSVTLTGTRVTPKGVAQLRKDLPKLYVNQ
jgi:hypothetical protein